MKLLHQDLGNRVQGLIRGCLALIGRVLEWRERVLVLKERVQVLIEKVLVLIGEVLVWIEKVLVLTGNLESRQSKNNILLR
jgi:hypothetical protein